MSFILIKPFNGRPVGTIMDVGEGPGKILIARGFAERVRRDDSESTVVVQSESGSTSETGDGGRSEEVDTIKRRRQLTRPKPRKPN